MINVWGLDASRWQLGDGRRLAVVLVSPELLVDFCKSGEPRFLDVTANALPADARLVSVYVDPDCPREVLLIVESETFEVTEVGKALPILKPPHFSIVGGER